MIRTLAIAALGLTLACTAAARADDVNRGDLEFFEKHVRPVLAERCFECHSSKVDEPDAGLRLDSRAGLDTGGESGAVVVAGDVEASRLLTAVSYDDVDLQMPPDGKLPDEAIEALREWVRRGAPWPAEAEAAATEWAPKAGFDLEARKKAHWAWHPIVAHAVPAVQNAAWPRSDADRFLLAKLEASGLQPAAEADRRTWIRRVTFDLIGLPPTVEEVDDFVADESAEAYAKVVDRLLASPHYGERWARHWLDLVRYAETKGHEFDYAIPNAYQYRDYAIRAFNADVPYDQFVREHLAGDLLAAPRLNPSEGFNESIIGTGFWFLGEEIHSPVDTRQDQADRFDNRIDVLSKTFLGLTVSCARCHDHKFDAISSRDYYALFGFLESSTERLARFDTMERDRAVAVELDGFDRTAQLPLRRAVAAALRPGVEQMASYLQAAAGATNGDGLDATVVAAWRSHLNAALDVPSDALHLVAKRLMRPETVTAATCGEPTQEAPPVEVVVDYSQAAPEQWIQDDVGFGLRPRAAGEAIVRNGREIRFTERAAAEFDAAWDARTLAPAQQLENGPMGRVVRPGRTLCTPKFELHGKVFFLVRGAGQVYAAVDQNSLVLGPLHLVLIHAFDTGGEWQWIERDLTYYRGHATHLEFTPAAGGQFALAMVVQGEQQPPLPVAGSPLGEPAAGATAQAVAVHCQQQFLDLLARFDAESVASSTAAAGDARLANWALSHPELFAADRAQITGPLETVAAAQTALRAALVGKSAAESRLCVAMQDVSGFDERVFLRGSPKNLGDVARRRGPEAIFGGEAIDAGTGSGRLTFAEQMVDPTRNPLLARVMVNRVWHHLFGRGIVASVDNFGVMGEAPTHPELLDFLAAKFVAEGWSLKRLIRELTLSSAYRMASHGSAEAEAADPQDLLLHRMRVRRLEGEAIRDAMLSISGSLDRTLYGPSTAIHLNEFMDGRGRPAASGPLDGANRRSLYIETRRNFPSPMMMAFDAPIPFSTVGRRNVSNVPAQSLVLLNDPLVHELAERWGRRVCAESTDPAERIDRMYLECFGREPTDAERTRCQEYLAAQDRATAWKELAHALWNVKEFVFVY